MRRFFFVLALLFARSAHADFVNFETPQVSPIAISFDGSTLAVCNTADARVELFSLATGSPVASNSIPVGIDPVSCRFRTNTELWVVNHISDSVSIIDLSLGTVVATIATDDEPCDVVFAGTTQKAFISCSQADTVQVANPVTRAITASLPVDAEDPRAMAVSNDGLKVYVAVFESGNGTTLLAGGADESEGIITFPPNVVDDAGTPHGGMNPPFNDTGAFNPPDANGGAPEVGLIVRRNAGGQWLDDTGADWSAWVDGANAADSGRFTGWTLLDHDVVVIDADTEAVSYVDSLMNANMALAVNPASGIVTVVGTEATNEVRFEPVINGTFVRVIAANTDNTSKLASADINADHLTYATPSVVQAERDKSIGDPRGIAWNAAGTKAYVTGMGSNNLIVLDAGLARAGLADTIEVREGPTGIVADDSRGQLYVLNRFDGSVSVVDMTTETETANVPLYDPTPAAIRDGRKHLYDTHKTSGLGQASCASCHLDARMDRLAWDLGAPDGAVKSLAGLNLGGNMTGLTSGFQPFHPMKGPMTTQTLQDIIGKEPFHWRGDRLGLEEFNPAFTGLLGDDVQLTTTEMQEFKDFLATIYFPPNPYRNLDNTLPTNLPLDGHYATGRFSGSGGLNHGDALPNGDAVAGLSLYRSQGRRLDAGNFSCVQCHALPHGGGTNQTWNGSSFETIPATANNQHSMLVSIDGSTNKAIKVPQLRNLYDKAGLTMIPGKASRAGFGFLHDGSVDTIESFVGGSIFDVANDQEIANLTAFMLSFAGSDFGITSPDPQFEPAGIASNDVHAAVGQQATLDGGSTAPLAALESVVDASARIELIARVRADGRERGYLYQGSATWQSDENTATVNESALLALASATTPITFTVVPAGTGTRVVLDRDEDGYFDHTEFLDGSNITDPGSFGPQAMEGEGDGMTEGEGEGAAEGEGEGSGGPGVAVSGDASVEEGGRLELFALVSGFTPTSYAWSKDGNPISGSDLNPLVIDPVALSDAGAYRVTASDESKTLVTSGVFTVTVYPEGGLPVMGGIGMAGLGACIIAFAVYRRTK